MKINLSIIPDEGQSWSINQKTGELNESLKDLIGPCSYKTDFYIRPLATQSVQSTFELRGSISTELPEECSRCGLDFKLPINTKFNNLLMPSLSTPRDAKYSKTNHFSDLKEGDLEIAEYSGDTFDAGEFFHELIALAEPFSPAPDEDMNGNCTVCHLNIKTHDFGYHEDIKVNKNPFGSLKNVKITTKN